MNELDQQRRLIAALEWLKLLRQRHPADFYEPHSICPQRSPRAGRPSGQLQFHLAPHIKRYICSGNGLGGTRAMAAEVDAWCRHTNRWQETPAWPVIVIWFCEVYSQFGKLRRDLEAFAFGDVPRYIEGGTEGARYVWPDGSTMYLGSYDSSWRRFEGIEADLIVFDEQPPEDLHERMMVRRRGKRSTKYISKASQVHGLSWMAEGLYRPWIKYHKDHGIHDEEAMMQAQIHPDLWLWPKGGAHDNPAVTDEQIQFLERQIFKSEKARKVSLFGGFESFSGEPVFSDVAIELQRKRLARHRTAVDSGSFVGLTAQEHDEIRRAERAARDLITPPIARF